MKKRFTILTLLSIIGLSVIVHAELTAVTVPPTMLHEPGAGLGYLGKVSYTLNINKDALGLYEYDSVTVSLEIVPAAGGDPLVLDAVEGAVGIIHILPNEPTRDIFFRYTGTPSGQYVARVKVDAIETDVMKKTKAMVNTATLSQMYPLFKGDAIDAGDGAFFHQKGMETTAGTLKDIYSADGPHGVNIRYGNRYATCFLTCGGLACTWDTDAAYEQGAAIAEEYRKDGRNVCLGPAMNIIMNPKGGRSFEYFSEDAYLTKKLAAAEVKGMATRGVLGTLKHFAVNNKENRRQYLDAIIDERSLHELYLPQYKECVTKAGALAVMTAFNKINGQYCTDSKYLLDDVLRNAWGFIGYTMSDWEALVNSKTNAVKWGADQLLPEKHQFDITDFQNIADAKNKAKHIVYANGKVGLLEPSYNRFAFSDKFMTQDKRNLVRRLGAKALVLAKNDDNVLPIPKTGKKIFITGGRYTAPPSDQYNPKQSQYDGQYEHKMTRLGGGDAWNWESSLVNVPESNKISPEKGITDYLASLGNGASTIVTSMDDADYIIVATGVHGEGEGDDRPDLRVFEDQLVLQALAKTNAKTIVLFTGGSSAIPGNWSNAPAILICFGPGQEQGYAIADVLFGDVCPGGKLNMTFPKTETQAANFGDVYSDNLQYGAANIAHGYFKVDYLNEEPLFAFGHGLSYTTFSYSNLSIYPSSIQKGDRVYVSVDVTNTGAVAGDEVVQLYLSLPSGTVPVRKQDLRGFDRIPLQPGQTQRVLFTLDPEDMAYFKVGATEFDGTGKWEILAGNYKVRIGTSSKITPAPDLPSIDGSFTIY